MSFVSPTGAVYSDEQIAAVAAFLSGNPEARVIVQAMTDYGVDAYALAFAWNRTLQDVSDVLVIGYAPPGFMGSLPPSEKLWGWMQYTATYYAYPSPLPKPTAAEIADGTVITGQTYIEPIATKPDLNSPRTSVISTPVATSATGVETIGYAQLTADQIAAINAAWDKDFMSPAKIVSLMVQYGVSVRNLSQATGISEHDLSVYFYASGQARGFAGAVWPVLAANVTDAQVKQYLRTRSTVGAGAPTGGKSGAALAALAAVAGYFFWS